jgi:ribosomal protein S12 methylthiotransferase
MQKGRIDIITMGCSKNLVDSERLIKQLETKGYSVFHDSHDVEGEIVVVNTCGFIGDAKEESIDMILQLAEGKSSGKIGKLIVMGCLSQRYLSELQESIQEVDEWYGKFDWTKIIDTLPTIKSEEETTPHKWERKLTTPSYSAYIKISEGCNRFCAYCAIPLITGRHQSRGIEEILAETKELVANGVKEFNIIAQDLSAYGTDLYGESRLAELIDRMSDIEGVRWIRLHYAYPVDFPWDVLEVMNRKRNVCHYLDIALQHISTPVLTNMRRHINKEETYEVIRRIRSMVPDIKLRTTLMVGFPGEDEKGFEELVEFVRDVKFDRMGAFAYSEEEDTWAQRHLKDDIPEEVKRERLDIIMDLQQDISYDLNRKMIGILVDVLVESVTDEEIVGRTEWDSPEVDPQVYIQSNAEVSKNIKPGDFVKVRITDAEAYELMGELA